MSKSALTQSWMGRTAQRMRARRFARFASLVEGLPKPVRILDVGGRAAFWAQHGWTERSDVEITTGNIEPQTRTHDNVTPIQLDATDMSQFADGSFDIAFSNSVIEHLFTDANQAAMAREICRVGRAYWVQTPNFWFPMEPHFRFLGWHWLPVSVRVTLLQRRGFGWRGKATSRAHARELVEEIRLLSRRQMRSLFPDALLWGERWFGLVKSWVAYGGFDGRSA